MAEKKLASHEFPTLFKQCDDKVMEWDIWVEAQTDGSAIIYKEFGYSGSKKQLKKDRVTAGKNSGRKNATNPFQQAVLDAEGEWKEKKTRKAYGETPEESAGKRDVAPMLAYAIEKCKTIDWANAFAQYKYDGHRCLIHGTDSGIPELVSREFGSITTMPHIAEALKDLVEPGQILDGELYCHGMTLNKIGSIIKNKSEDKGREQLKFYGFDMVGEQDFASRYLQLKKILPRSAESIILAPTVRVTNKTELAVVEKAALESQHEGGILRHGRRGYQTGKRVNDVLKVKQFKEGEFEIIDAKPGRGEFAGVAIFLCVTKDGHEFEATAPGDMAEKRRLWDTYPEHIGKLLTIKYQCFTATDEPVPFQPVAKGFKEGKAKAKK